MASSFELLMEAYIKCYMESEVGKIAMGKAMMSYISKYVISRLTSIQSNELFQKIYYTPYKQIDSLLDLSEDILEVLDNVNKHSELENLANIVMNIYSFNHIKSYYGIVTYGETEETRMVDGIIQRNRTMMASIKARNSIMSLEEFLSLPVEQEEKNQYNGPERNNESKLRKLGYNVSQDSLLSDYDRQKLLKRLIDNKDVSKGYVISYLKHMIQINGKKQSNYSALERWKRDLQYVLKL